MKFFRKHKFVLLFLLLVVTFFTAQLTITWDSAHYLSYVEIFEGVKPFSTWDIVRGPVFPLFIFLSNLLFGKNAVGILTMIFIIYLVYCYFICLISKKIFAKSNHKRLFSFIFIVFAVINPIIFGYFHTLLTEFLAISLMIISCYVSFNWIYVNGKMGRIAYSLFYIFALTFAYFLKQPYICIIFVPMFISIFISIIHNHNLKNVIYNVGTVVVSSLVLVLCIFSWNRILISKNVDMNTGRDSSSLLTAQLLNAISNFNLSYVDDFSVLKNDESLSNNERELAKKMIDRDGKILLIKIYDDGKLVESDILSTGADGTSVLDVIKEISVFSVKHPNLIIESYSKNYCAISGICIIATSDSIEYWITDQYDFIHLYENNGIAYKFLHSGSNMFYLSSEKYESAKFYEQVNGLSITSKLLYLLQIPTNFIYEMVMILMPIVSFFNLIVLFVKRKTFKRDRLYYLGIMYLFSSFLCTLISSSSGQIIDRYSVYCFIPGLIGIIVSINSIIKNIKVRKEKNSLWKSC